MRLPSIGYVNRTLEKAYGDHNTLIHFKRFQNNRPSNIYGERLGKSFGDPIAVLGYYESSPTALKLQDLGWSTETVNILARFPFTHLLEAGLANQDGTLLLTTSDRMINPHGVEYEISEIQGREPFRTGIPTFVWIGGKNFISGR